MNHDIQEIENHIHNQEVWFEPVSEPSGETRIADPAGSIPGSIKVFQIDAGDSAWGDWTLCIGSLDTPSTEAPGMRYFDMHKIGIQTCERTTLYYIQLGFGTVADGVLTGKKSTIWFNPASVAGKSESILIITPRVTCGTKVWARALCPSYNTAKVAFNLGAHFYLV
jgi:hypothetical protein